MDGYVHKIYQDPGFPDCVLHSGDQCYSFQLPLDLKRRLICVHNKAKQFFSAAEKNQETLMHVLTHHLEATQIDVFHMSFLKKWIHYGRGVDNTVYELANEIKSPKSGEDQAVFCLTAEEKERVGKASSKHRGDADVTVGEREANRPR